MVYTFISCLSKKERKENEQSIFKYIYKENFQTSIHRETTKLGTYFEKATIF